MDRNILFLCTGNSARSQMGEAFLRHHAGNIFHVYSAGTEPAAEIFPPVLEVMQEIGIDLTDRKPRGIGEFLGRVHFEAVIIVCSDADKNCPVMFGTARRLFWPFPDPSAVTGTLDEVLQSTRRIRDQMDRRIREWLRDQGIRVPPCTLRDTQIPG